jgi:uncharacterized SAM-binding protein YcdF (DUF218 family)
LESALAGKEARAGERCSSHLAPVAALRMFIIGKIGWALVQPGNLLLLSLLAGVLLTLFYRGRRGKILVAVSALAFLALAVLPIGPAMPLALEERFPRPPALPEKLDGILVLGGAVDPALSLTYGETVFNNSVARVLTGIALARQHPEAELALVGGEGGFVPVGLAEARATYGFVVNEGIAPARIIIEERSRSTHENAVYAKRMIRPKPGQIWVLVTSAFHMPRAVVSFRAVAWPVVPYPADYKIDPRTGLRANFSLLDGLSATTLAGKEWAGLFGYWAMGWTQELFPAPEARSAENRG